MSEVPLCGRLRGGGRFLMREESLCCVLVPESPVLNSNPQSIKPKV